MAGENSGIFSDKIMGATVSDGTPTVRDIIDANREKTPPPTFDALAAEFLAQPAPGSEADSLMQTLYGALVGYALTRDPELIGLPPTIPDTLPPSHEW